MGANWAYTLFVIMPLVMVASAASGIGEARQHGPR
jgi:hypothetical protein